jgi:hypothetical protein
MFSLPLLALVLSAAEPTWHNDCDRAVRLALEQKKDLLVYFRADDGLDRVLRDRKLQPLLSGYVCARVGLSAKYNGKKFIDHPQMEDMMGKSGLAIISLHDGKLSSHREVISAHPLVGSRYGWVPEYGVEQVKVILSLPARATLTQRSMLYALRVHPERPQSVHAKEHPAFMAHAKRHSAHQAAVKRQHHADIIAVSAALESEAGVPIGGASEVVAESWGAVVGGENVLEAAFSCVDAWRHSSGHWGAVARKHRYFGYDLARGSNGTWYATGIFGN